MTSVIILLLVMQAVHFVCTCKLYTLSGHKAWEAAVPFYSAYILIKIIQRPWWWTILLYIPVVGNVMALVIWTDTSRAFGYRGVWWTLLAVFTLGLSLGWISWFGRLRLRIPPPPPCTRFKHFRSHSIRRHRSLAHQSVYLRSVHDTDLFDGRFDVGRRLFVRQ